MTVLKAIFIGCVEFSRSMLEELLSIERVEICAVLTRQTSAANSDFVDLGPLAVARGVPVHYASGNDQSVLAESICKYKPDVVFCLGWSYLLNDDILKLPRMGVIGYHPTLLPQNRGRHPIIWTLALGLSETGSTFFKMDSGADSGPILSQQCLAIYDVDDSGTLYRRLTEVAGLQLRKLVCDLDNNSFTLMVQNSSLANYWRKRTKEDGKIDWRMSAKGIRNLVRSLQRPYPGAYVEFCGLDVKVWRVRTQPAILTCYEPGRIMSVIRNEISVQTGDGVIVLEDHEFELVDFFKIHEGGYL